MICFCSQTYSAIATLADEEVFPTSKIYVCMFVCMHASMHDEDAAAAYPFLSSPLFSCLCLGPTSEYFTALTNVNVLNICSMFSYPTGSADLTAHPAPSNKGALQQMDCPFLSYGFEYFSWCEERCYQNAFRSNSEILQSFIQLSWLEHVL